MVSDRKTDLRWKPRCLGKEARWGSQINSTLTVLSPDCLKVKFIFLFYLHESCKKLLINDFIILQIFAKFCFAVETRPNMSHNAGEGPNICINSMT